MNNEEILTRAIKTAVANGWDGLSSSEHLLKHPAHFAQWVLDSKNIERYIFNHDFAKALWGEMPVGFKDIELTDYKRDEPIQHPDGYLKNYERHLQRMVIASDPIAYLGDNL